MRVRVWGAWVVRKVYWSRIGLLVLACVTCAFVFGGEEERTVVRYSPVATLDDGVAEDWPRVVEVSLSSEAPAGYLVSSSQGVVWGHDGVQERVWEGAAYDTLRTGDALLISERYGDRVVCLQDGVEVLSIPADGPVDCELDGTTLVVVQNGSQEVVAYDLETQDVLWRVGGFSNHYDVALIPGGGMVVADSGNGRVVEFDAQRNQVAQYDGLGFPSSVEVLPNGNLQVTTYHDGEVLELERFSGDVVRRLKIEGTVFRALRQGDGSTLVFEGEQSDGQGRLHWFGPDGELLEVAPLAGGVDYEQG